MDLWIRSQDKETLCKVDDIHIEEQSLYTDTHLKICLGTYKAKERALEVLDEIQDLFTLSIQNETFERSDLIIKASMLPKVYQMPKE